MDDLSKQPLFSIIVPTLNVEAMIQRCFSSITQQVFQDFEMVVVDGGSTDRTLESASAFKPLLGSRLAVHVAKDGGVYDAMNRGVGHSRGAWLFFLGADDRLHEVDTLGQVAAFIREHSASQLVHGDVVMLSSSLRDGGAFNLDRLLFERNICHQSIFYRRELFSTIGPYNLRYPIWADWDFNIRCFSNPALVARYMDIIVADYDDTGGLSMKEDVELRKRLPVFILNEARQTWFGRLRKAARQRIQRLGKRGD
jgi:glycosyltransferase involved in cell wall biosynthesis